MAVGGRDALGAADHVFSPRQLVTAVTFHLIDERIAARVCPQSVERAVRRLTRAGTWVRISGSLWRAMGNRQRMEWLLKSSVMDYRMRGGAGEMAVLI